jgi:hypothetical protein
MFFYRNRYALLPISLAQHCTPPRPLPGAGVRSTYIGITMSSPGDLQIITNGHFDYSNLQYCILLHLINVALHFSQ